MVVPARKTNHKPGKNILTLILAYAGRWKTLQNDITGTFAVKHKQSTWWGRWDTNPRLVGPVHTIRVHMRLFAGSCTC